MERESEFVNLNIRTILSQHFKRIKEQEELEKDDFQNRKWKIRVEIVFDLLDQWQDTSLLSVTQNGSFLFEDSFSVCQRSMDFEICKKQIRNICRNEHPDLIGQHLAFTFEKSLQDDLNIGISVRKDTSGLSPVQVEEIQSGESPELEFAVGLYAVFVSIRD